MDKKINRLSPTPNEDKQTTNEVTLELENEILGTRWAIPRPSLSCSLISNESNGRVSRESSPTKSRGSASSQGSASNHSTQSASSGSLLLNAANLSKMNTLNSPLRQSAASKGGSNYQNNLTAFVHSTGNPSYSSNESEEQIDNVSHSDPFWKNVKLGSAINQRIDDKQETESVASSTHFTVVNGFTRHKSMKSENQMWCCKSSHQITVLIVTMTILFTAGILAAICYVEMRQRREMGSSRFS